MLGREVLEKRERELLKPYACFSDSVKRQFDVNKDLMRTEFQRDRDRILHSKSFRRLEYKTQVYLSTQNDHMRTRLTHSLEVSQIARSIALQLGLNIDLVEAISLGHDVGHTPFGHAAERKLNELARKEDAKMFFKHNMQSVRVLDKLEEKYPYNGLGLTDPVLEGILKHSKYYETDDEYINRLMPEQTDSYTLEGQVVKIADDIAQITHDTDDFLRVNILKLDSFLKDDIFRDIEDFYSERYNYTLNLEKYKTDTQRKEIVIRCFVDFLVTNLILETEKILTNDLRAMKIDKFYMTYGPHSNRIEDFHKKLNKDCFENYGVKEMDKRGSLIVNSLFDFYKKFPERLPSSTRSKFDMNGTIAIIDHISGMTDKYAIEQYNSIIEVS